MRITARVRVACGPYGIQLCGNPSERSGRGTVRSDQLVTVGAVFRVIAIVGAIIVVP